MSTPINVLLQTTIEPTENDWHIGRFSLLKSYLASLTAKDDAQGPALAESTFHHFADYNWDPGRGCPDFVTETPGKGLTMTPRAMDSVRCYVRNVALWLAGQLDPTRPCFGGGHQLGR
jgi:hypothetical protein